MTFKEKLVILRKAKGLTQDEFAAAVGVSRQAVYKWECGQSYPEVPKLLEMKLLFSISIDELLDDSFDIPVPEKKKRKRVSKETADKIEKEVNTSVGASNIAPSKKAAAPKVAPIQATATPKASPVTMAAPIIPKAAPAPKIETPAYTAPAEVTTVIEEKPTVTEAPKAEKKVFIPTPAQLEDSKAEEVASNVDDDKDEPKKSGLFGRIFGRK